MSEKNTSFIKARVIGLTCTSILLLVSSSISTQFIAERLAHHPALGKPLFGQIYSPFDWWGWAFKFYDYSPNIYSQAILIFEAGAFLSVFVGMLIIGLKSRSSRKHEGIHGTAHFATPEDVRESGLLPANGKKGEGVYCGGYDIDGRTHYLRHNGPEHVCVIAPTGSGKGVGLVIPTLLSEPGSVFVLDRKGENYAMTAGWRKKEANNIVLRFDPAEEGSCSWNPLEEIRFGTRYQIGDTQSIALMVIDDDGKGIAGNHWRTAAHALLVGTIIHALYKAEAVGRYPTLSDCAFILSGVGDFAAPRPENEFDDMDDKPLASLFSEMANVALNGNEDVAQEAQLNIRAAGSRFAATASKELASIISTAHNALSLYLETNVKHNTSRSDFKISDLVQADKPVSLYFISTPRNADRLKPLARLLLTQIALGLADQMKFDNGRSKTNHKHRLLLMLDEFPTLGRLDVFENALAFIRGYGIKAYIIIQDIQQLYKSYTNFESIISNCHVRIAYAPNKLETAEWLSKMAGQTTVIKEQISTSGKRFGTLLGQVSRSYQEIQRPLMTADEIMRLPGPRKDDYDNILEPGEMLVFVAGNPVIRGRQILYFLDPVFDKRSRMPPPAKSDTVRA